VGIPFLHQEFLLLPILLQPQVQTFPRLLSVEVMLLEQPQWVTEKDY
jgi:hypothetical protein